MNERKWLSIHRTNYQSMHGDVMTYSTSKDQVVAGRLEKMRAALVKAEAALIGPAQDYEESHAAWLAVRAALGKDKTDG